MVFTNMLRNITHFVSDAIPSKVDYPYFNILKIR